MYAVKIVSQAVTSGTISVSIKRRCPKYNPLNGNAQKVTCIIFLYLFMFDSSFVAVFAVVAVAIAIAEVEVVVFVVVVVVIVVVVGPSPSSAALLWVQGIFHYCEEFIERQTNEGKNKSESEE